MSAIKKHIPSNIVRKVVFFSTNVNVPIDFNSIFSPEKLQFNRDVNVYSAFNKKINLKVDFKDGRN